MTGRVVDSGHLGDSDDDGFELRPQDKRIRELHQEGFSTRKISKILKAEGMPLGKTAVIEHLKELRLILGDNIQANHRVAGYHKEMRKNQKWYKIMVWLKDHAERYRIRNGFKISLRTAFYDAKLEGLVEEDEYATFDQKATDARIGYVDQDGELLLPELPPDCFADDSRKTIDNYDDDEPVAVIEPGEIPDPIEFIDLYINKLKDAPMYYDGKAAEGEDGQIGGYWYGQPEYVEVWQEKNDLMPGFEKILEDVYVKIRGNKGYSSFTFIYQCTEELKQIIDNKGMDPEDVTILLCGDWDPSGENIDYYIKKRLRQLGLGGVNVVRVAVTPEQIDEYHFPLLPVEKKPNKKYPNPNMLEFIRRHGTKATHLNAFFSEAHLPTFKKILIDAVKEHWDQDIYDEMVEEYDVAADEPDKLPEEELTEKRQEMYERITKAFKPGWYEG